MFILYAALFCILTLCFPASVGALFRVFLRKSDARLVALGSGRTVIREIW